MEQYLHSYYFEDIVKILKSPKKAQIHEILLDLTALKLNAPKFYNELMTSTDYKKIANKWIKSIKKVQQEIKDQITNNSIGVSNDGTLLDVQRNFSNASTVLLDDDQASVSIL